MKTPKQHGFTIVELLIVIVVIAILAAISIVAYNGIQGRAHDSAVQQDIKNMVTKYEVYKIDNGTYPIGNGGLGQINVSISRGAYEEPTAGYNLLNCTNSDNSGTDYVILATSKSGSRFYATNTSGGVKKDDGATWAVSAATCATFNASADTANGAGYASGDTPKWRTWTN